MILRYDTYSRNFVRLIIHICKCMPLRVYLFNVKISDFILLFVGHIHVNVLMMRNDKLSIRVHYE